MNNYDSDEPIKLIKNAVYKHSGFMGTNKELHEMTEEFRTISGSSAVIMNESSLSEDYIIPRAVSGIDKHLITGVLGFPGLKTSYEIDPGMREAFHHDGLLMYESLTEIARYQIPENLCKLVSEFFDTGRIYVLGLKSGEHILGNLIFILKRGRDLQNPELLEFYSQHVSLLMLQQKRSKSVFFQMLIEQAESDPEGKALLHSFYRATERIPDVVYQLDSNGCIVFINHAVERYGYLKEELIGRNILEIVHPADRDSTHWNLTERRTGNRKTIDVEVRFITGNSKTVSFNVTEKESIGESVVRLYAEGLYESIDDGMNFKGTLGICRDISNERNLKNDLEVQTEIFKVIAEHIDEGIWLEQLRPPRIIYSNPAAQSLAAPVKQNLDRNLLSYIDMVHPKDLTRILNFINENEQKDMASSIDFRILSSREKEQWIRLRLFPVFRDGGITEKRVGVASDITEQRHARENLIDRAEMSEAYVKEINHRVKNNLSMIESILSLEINALPEDQSQTALLLSDIRGRIQSTALVHQMLYDLSKMGKIEVCGYLERLSKTIVESFTSTNTAPRLDFNFDGEHRMPADNVLPLGMITNELIINALKHAFPDRADGIIAIGFREDRDGGYILSVEDNGIALSIENERIEPSGIGESLVKALIGQLNGKLDFLRSEDRKGFQIRF